MTVMDEDALYPTLVAALLAERRELQEQIAQLQQARAHEVSYLRGEIQHERNLRPLTGDSRAMRELRHAIGQVAPTDSTVLILGETGVGKELVARAIHQLSPRRQRLLVSVNCAALAPSVIASELFGHEAGAFTGAAKRRIGRFELAHQGTLFLDEIAELTPETQVLLLRVLQERVIERVGGAQPIPIDVRIIAATHQDLEQRVQEGRFRADLYFRLSVFPLRAPALRERPEDIADLVRHFIGHFNRRMQKRIERIDGDSLTLLRGYAWPGNVRELENLIERAMIIATGDTLRIDPAWLPATPATSAPPQGLRALERATIEETLRKTNGKIYGPDGAARVLGLKPTTLYGKLRKYGIEPRRP
jgi:formate hydrogenlyase transcriptional activator